MDWKYILNYWREVIMTANSRAFAKSDFSKLIVWLFIIIYGFTILACISLSGWATLDGLNEQFLKSVEMWRNWAILSTFVFTILFGVFVFRIPPDMQRAKELEVEELEKLISLKAYDDIDLERFYSPETIEEKRSRLNLNGIKQSEKLEFLVINSGNVSLLSSFVTMEDLHWEHPEYSNTYDGIETKPFSWFDFKSSDGRRDIPAKGRGHLHVATIRTDIMTHFKFIFYDGESSVLRTLPGKYTIKIRLDGKFKYKDSVEDLNPVFFNIYFVFDGSFTDVKIKKIS